METLACRIENKHMHCPVEKSHAMDLAACTPPRYIVLRIYDFEDFIVCRIHSAFQGKT